MQQINPLPCTEKLPEPRLAGHIVCALCTSQFQEVWEFHAWKSSLEFPVSLFSLTQPAGAMCHRNAAMNSPQVWGSPAGWCLPTCCPGCGVKSAPWQWSLRAAEGRRQGLERSHQLCCNLSCAPGSQIHLGAHSVQLICVLFLLAPVLQAGTEEKFPAKIAPFSLKFLPDHGVKVVEEQEVLCPNKLKS